MSNTYMKTFNEEDWFAFSGCDLLPDNKVPVIGYADAEQGEQWTLIISGDDDVEENCSYYLQHSNEEMDEPWVYLSIKYTHLDEHIALANIILDGVKGKPFKHGQELIAAMSKLAEISK